MSRIILGSSVEWIQGALVRCKFGSKNENRKAELLDRIKEVGEIYRIKAYQSVVDSLNKEVLFEKINE